MLDPRIRGAVVPAVMWLLFGGAASAQDESAPPDPAPATEIAPPDSAQAVTEPATEAGAEEPAPPVEELVREALQRAPALAAQAAGVEAARQMEEPAGALPDPVLEVMLQDAGFPDWTVGEEEMSMIGPQITQGIPFPGKQGARKSAAAAQTNVRRQELQRSRREIARDVRLLVADVYALDRERESLDASAELLDLLSMTVSHHIETGDMGQAEAVRIRLLASRSEERRADLFAERAEAVAALNRLLDRAGDAVLGVVTELPDTAPPPAALDSLAEASFADVAVTEAGVSAAEARLHATRRDLRPDFMTGAGIGFRGDLDPVVTFRLGMELPLWQWKRQRPMIRAAEAEAEMARHELRDARALARAEAARLRAAWVRADEQVRRYRDSFVPTSRLAFDNARSAYLGRRGDFPAVVEALTLWLDARAGLARREADRFATWAELHALLDPAPETRQAPEGAP